jgi:hypothetical protein
MTCPTQEVSELEKRTPTGKERGKAVDIQFRKKAA